MHGLVHAVATAVLAQSPDFISVTIELLYLVRQSHKSSAGRIHGIDLVVDSQRFSPVATIGLILASEASRIERELSSAVKSCMASPSAICLPAPREYEQMTARSKP